MYAYSDYLQKTFGSKTYKVIVASRTTCPTRDGSLGKGGCSFCDLRGSGSFFGTQGRSASVTDQINQRLPAIADRFDARTFLAYFQSYTNTYGDEEALLKLYHEALAHPQITGLCIGTRPDCLPDSFIDRLEILARSYYISLELGVQSLDDNALLFLTRGHSAECSLDAIDRLKERAPSVHICVHLMLGIPSEAPQTHTQTAKILSTKKIHGVKLHQLMVLSGTALAEKYQQEPFETLSLESYSKLIAEFLSHLAPTIYIERLYATASHKAECIAPTWSKERWRVHNTIRDYLEKNMIKQGAENSF